MKKLMKAVVGAAFALGLFAPSARAGSTSAVWVDTRAFVLAEILPEGAAWCEVKSGADCAYLTTTFNANVDDAGTYELPDDMGPLAFDPNGRTWTGKAGADGTSATAGGDGSPVFQIGSNTTVKMFGDSGSISGGNGGDGTPAGKGAYAFIDAAGAEVKVTDPCGLVKTGADGEWLISVDDVVVKAIAVGDTVVTQTVAVTFTSEITLPTFADWLWDKLKVKSSADLATLDKAEAETPTPVQAKLSDDHKTVTTDLEVDKPSEDTGFFRVVVP